MSVHHKALFLTLALVAACTHVPQAKSDFSSQLSGTGKVVLEGWARIHGEVMLYSSKEAFRREEDYYPSCVSGVFSEQKPGALQRYKNKKLRVTGILYDYETLPDEEAPVLARKILSGTVIPNFCMGQKVLMITEIGPLS